MAFHDPLSPDPAPFSTDALFSWALYDWGNSAFATTVMAGFFPVFFKQYWSDPSDPTMSTLRLGAANSIASALMVVAAPLLGAIADAGGKRRGLLALFTYLGCLATLCLSFVGKNEWFWAAGLFVLGNLGFAGGCIFYDSLLVDVAEPRDRDRVSALGYAMGYLGGGVLFALNVLMSQKPEWFGLANAAEAVRISFVTVAIWWGLFSIPILRIPERTPEKMPWGRAIAKGASDLWATTRRLKQLPTADALSRQLLVLHGRSRHRGAHGARLRPLSRAAVEPAHYGAYSSPSSSAFPPLSPSALSARGGARSKAFSFASSFTARRWWAPTNMSETIHFYGLAVVIGLVQGGVQALSRSFYSRLIPADRPAEFFGFFNMMGKFAAVLGPILMGATARLTGSSRASILSVLVLFLIGGLLLLGVDERKGAQEALAWKSATV